MKRRDFIKNSVLGIATSATAALGEYLPEGQSDGRKQKKPRAKPSAGESNSGQIYARTEQSIFPLEVPTKKWSRFQAEGFENPACGIVYRKEDDVPHGMPLGGAATGFMDIDTDGTFGYFDLFNSGSPRAARFSTAFSALPAAAAAGP